MMILDWLMKPRRAEEQTVERVTTIVFLVFFLFFFSAYHYYCTLDDAFCWERDRSEEN